MAARPKFYVQGFERRASGLLPGEPVAGSSEGEIFRRGFAMSPRVQGLVFFKIETSADGDVWSEVEILAVDGDVPPDAA